MENTMGTWWKEAVFYQIYMPGFCDGNRDGIGDFAGIITKLPYLKRLGIKGIWLTPFYPSPKVDQGYDVSDYYGIDTDYGTMEEFEEFLTEAHRLGIRVIADVVINHTSTEHPWFLESRSSRSNPKRDWYIWKNPINGGEPNNWESFFGEKAWEYDGNTQMYYYHSFAKEQADLNWANPSVKKAVFKMLDFWAEKGVDGFRLDVINNLTLTDCMIDNPEDASGNQIHKFDINQHGIHDFLKELKQYLNKGRELFLVGEISSDELEQIHSFTEEGQLDTTFNFNLGSMESFVFPDFYQQLADMTELYAKDSYPTIFFGSHDMPRFPSRFHFNQRQVKSLFTLMMTYRGIPFVYFGDELGMENQECRRIEDARDIQGIIAYRQAKAADLSEEEAMAALNAKSRDHSRNTMYWDDTENGGFSEAEPWIPFQKQRGNSAICQMEDESSLFSYVSRLIGIRSENAVLCTGDCRVESPADNVILCRRQKEESIVLAVINFSDREVTVNTEYGAKSFEILIETERMAAVFGKKGLSVKAESSVVLHGIKQ